MNEKKLFFYIRYWELERDSFEESVGYEAHEFCKYICKIEATEDELDKFKDILFELNLDQIKFYSSRGEALDNIIYYLINRQPEVYGRLLTKNNIF